MANFGLTPWLTRLDRSHPYGLLPTAAPGVGSLAYTGSAPTFSTGQNTSRSTDFRPYSRLGSFNTWAQQLNKNVSEIIGTATPSPGTATITYTGLQPIAFGGALVPGTGPGSAIITQFTQYGSTFQRISAFAPTTGITVPIPVATITYGGIAPQISISANTTIEVPSASVAYTGLAPAVMGANPLTVAPGAGSVSYTGLVPSASISADTEIEVSTAQVVYSGLAPTFSAGVTIEVPLSTVRYIGFAPVAESVLPIDLRYLTVEPVGTIQTEEAA